MNVYQVKLPSFEGPFDLLYHLIEEQQVNIYDIPIATITSQYLEYLHLMEILDMEVASEFLIMAATLLEIKSRMLLPKEKPSSSEFTDENTDESGEFSDARDELVERLIEYKKFKLIALELREMEKRSSKIFKRTDCIERGPEEVLQISLSSPDLLNLYQNLLQRRMHPPIHRVVMDKSRLSERISEIRETLRGAKSSISFFALLKGKNSRYDSVLSFMALLEMSKSGEISLAQKGNFAPIYIRHCEIAKKAE